jgi:hypothetical protein
MIFDWKPLTPADLIQALAIPVTTIVSVLLFRMGKNDEKRRLILSFSVDMAKELSSHIIGLKESGVSYHCNTMSATDRQGLAIKINLDMKSLSLLLGKFAQTVGYRADYFAIDHSRFHAAVSGGQFGSSKIKKLLVTDPVIVEISWGLMPIRAKSWQIGNM